MSDDPNVIEIRPGISAPAGMPEPEESPIAGVHLCEHPSFLLDSETREVNCRHCHANLEPYEALLIIGRQWDKYAGWVRHAKWKRDGLLQECRRLKEDEQRVKSRLRRARRNLEKEGEGGC